MHNNYKKVYNTNTDVEISIKFIKKFSKYTLHLYNKIKIEYYQNILKNINSNK